MRRVLTLMLAVMLSLCLAACQQEDSGHFSLTVADHTSQEEQNGSAKKQDEIVENPNILVAYDPAQQPVKEAAGWIAQELSADLTTLESAPRDKACTLLTHMAALCHSQEADLRAAANTAARLYPRLGGCAGILVALFLL